jgi:hypothetical protein
MTEHDPKEQRRRVERALQRFEKKASKRKLSGKMPNGAKRGQTRQS